MSTQPSSATDPGAALIAALAERDFSRLAETLTPDVRMRALIPPASSRCPVPSRQRRSSRPGSATLKRSNSSAHAAIRSPIASTSSIGSASRSQATPRNSSSSTCSAHSRVTESALSISSAQASVLSRVGCVRGFTRERDRVTAVVLASPSTGSSTRKPDETTGTSLNGHVQGRAAWSFLDCSADLPQVPAERVRRIVGTAGQVLIKRCLCTQCLAGRNP
jgi:hypothetical protein